LATGLALFDSAARKGIVERRRGHVRGPGTTAGLRPRRDPRPPCPNCRWRAHTLWRSWAAKR